MLGTCDSDVDKVLLLFELPRQLGVFGRHVFTLVEDKDGVILKAFGLVHRAKHDTVLRRGGVRKHQVDLCEKGRNAA